MRAADYKYIIFRDNNPQKFKSACKMIEDKFLGADKKKLLIDVDGSTIQTYSISNKDIDVYDDYDYGMVYVLSDINLDKLFK